MSTQTNITSTPHITNNEFIASKEVQNFCKIFSILKNSFYETINELEFCNPSLFYEYAYAIKALIKSDFMYSNKEYPIMIKDDTGKKIPKLDKDGNPITIVNKQMVESLSESGFKTADTILDDLWSHILTKGLYYINHANNEKHAYNMIKVAINRKLCDFTRAMKHHEPMTNSISLGCSASTEEGDEIVIEVADNKVDIECAAILWDAKNNIIHQNINYLIDNKKCHRMIAYIANIANITNKELFHLIYENGYSAAIHQIASILMDMEINISYLESMNLVFPKEHNNINPHCIGAWKNEGLKQVRDYMLKQESHRK